MVVRFSCKLISTLIFSCLNIKLLKNFDHRFWKLANVFHCLNKPVFLNPESADSFESAEGPG